MRRISFGKLQYEFWRSRKVVANKPQAAQTHGMRSEQQIQGSTERLDSSTPPRERLSDIEHSISEYLMMRYGPVLDSKAIIEILKFPTVNALERSLQRGNMTLKFMPMEHRRGMFVLVHEMARYLAGQAIAEDSQQPAAGQVLGKERQIRQNAV